MWFRSAATLLLGAALAAPACTGDVRDSAAPAAPADPPGRRLRVLAVDSPALAAFERTTPSYETTAGVRVAITRRNPDEILRDVDAATAAGDDAFDLLVVPHRWLGQLVEAGFVQPLDGFREDPSLYDARLLDPEKDLFPEWWTRLGWYRGRAYGYPFQIRPASLWYREDLFDDEDEASAFERRYGRPFTIPRTPSELEQAAEFFYRPQQNLYGTVLHGRGDRSIAFEWLEYAAMFGAAILDSASGDQYGDIVVNSPKAVEATEFLVGLGRFSPPDAKNYAEIDALRAFERREVALGVMRHDLALLGADPQATREPGGIGFAPVPSTSGSPVTSIDGDVFLIPRRAAQPREAFALMQWALSHDAQVDRILNGGLAARPSSFKDARVTGLPKARQSRPFMQIWTFPALVANATTLPPPTIPESGEIAAAMSPGLARILAGDVAPRAGLDAIAARLAQVLKGKARLRFPPSRTP